MNYKISVKLTFSNVSLKTFTDDFIINFIFRENKYQSLLSSSISLLTSFLGKKISNSNIVEFYKVELLATISIKRR